jgi:hypothetical protein
MIGSDQTYVKSQLKNVITQMLNWYSNNQMQANPDQSQLIIFHNGKEKRYDYNITIGSHVIKNQSFVKLFGVQIDDKLNFGTHVTDKCKKAIRKYMFYAG